MNGSSSGVRERVDVAGDLEYRIAGRGGIVVVTLRPGAGLLAEPGGLLYRRGDVGWSLASTGRNVLGRFLNRAMRRAAAGRVVLLRLTGTGMAFLQAPASSTELELAAGEEVVCFDASVEYELRLARIGGGIVRRSGVEWMAALTGPGRVRLQAASPPPA